MCTQSPVYFWVVFGNVFNYSDLYSIITLMTITDPALQTLMYSFTSNFSFVKICLHVAVTIQRMLMDFYTQKVIIPLFSFPTQLFYCPHAWRHRVPMNIMAYDHFVAICIPPYYLLVLKKICVVQLVSVCMDQNYSGCQTYHIFFLSYCVSKKINYFL